MKGFSIKTEIEEYDTFERFAKEAQLGEKDLVLCGEHTYKQYVEPLSLGVQTLFREKYGKGEPTDGAVDAILDALRDKNFDRIVAIGGGTVIDIAKAVAVAAPEDKVDDLYDHVSELEKRHPLIIVPTTCGTGSEVTNISVMNRVSKGVKMGLASDAMLADKAVLITNLLDSMPYQVFATSSIDAMVHSAESFLSPNGCSISRLFSSEALKLILTCWDKVVKEGGEEAWKRYAAEFISDKLKSDGWYVTQQEFPVFRYKDVFSEPYNIGENGEPVGTGINIIAELPDFDSSKPTLILSAHYDTTKENIGIIDNGSGTAFLLSAGKWISKFNGEYNLRLIFFDVEESRMYGSKYYLENLSLEEHSGIIADINFDMLGGNHLSIGTVNGFESALSIMVMMWLPAKLCLKHNILPAWDSVMSVWASFIQWRIRWELIMTLRMVLPMHYFCRM